MKKRYLLIPFVAIVVMSLLAGSVFAAGIELDKQISVDDGDTWDDADGASGPIVTEGDSILFKYILTNTEEVPLLYDLTDSDHDLGVDGLLVEDGSIGPGATTEIISDPVAAGPGNFQYETSAQVDAVAEDGTTYQSIDLAYYYSIIAAQTVAIDIKPGGEPNSINLKSKGVVPLALLSSEEFDATTIFDGDSDPAVYFAGAGGEDVRWAIEDVNEDGLPDVIFHFKTTEITELDENSTEGEFSISYSDDPEGNPIASYVASDTVNMVPKGNGAGNSSSSSSSQSNNGNHGSGNNGNANGHNK